MDDEILMPFGKHKDKPLTDIPTDYLEWVLLHCDRPRPLMNETDWRNFLFQIEDELAERSMR